jgi:hypothetical protein
VTDVLRRREIYTHRHTERMTYEDRGRNKSEVATSQDLPKIIGHYHNLGKARILH